MGQNLRAKVNDAHDFEFSEAEIQSLDVQESKNKLHILQNNESVQSEILKSDFLNKKYNIKINANTYVVSIKNDLDLLIKEMGLSLAASQVVNDIKAPMPGLILDINVSEGDEVSEGDQLLVLEAMKMENAITAPRNAVIKSISVNKSETVTKNQLLIEME
ncbi:MAG: acetyl-CoA carboxylase biotin carboxyl carrier protein subunit [Psychroflexus sp.]|uniref:acetyl-CoA carboxylase biotin carboxyl carrier protein subunit n=1 Tax=Psychroflexus sp. S27 TaxID=1982757 RepID=UPI000C2A7D1F|nr:acetyl-CoA carboxylase biotin carboxyl carrier protein subunit [Psychroflexus sp. S27]PJX24555.1 acetyl-CoA carboxylase biotin carboxyl carrier protein subunit [Psychroflexus sp. S27]